MVQVVSVATRKKENDSPTESLARGCSDQEYHRPGLFNLHLEVYPCHMFTQLHVHGHNTLFITILAIYMTLRIHNQSQ